MTLIIKALRVRVENPERQREVKVHLEQEQAHEEGLHIEVQAPEQAQSQ